MLCDYANLTTLLSSDSVLHLVLLIDISSHKVDILTLPFELLISVKWFPTLKGVFF